MIFKLTVMANEPAEELRLVRQLEEALADMVEVHIKAATRLTRAEDWGQVIFLDAKLPRLDEILDGMDRTRRAIFLIVSEGDALNPEVMAAIDEERVDDVLVRPFRRLEVLSKLRHYQQILLWDEVKELNASFSQVLSRLHDDLKLAERIQKNKSPLRFPDVKGFHVSSRYLAGMRSGGDHFDLAESRSGGQMSVILSDSSSYGLSSAVLSVLMKVAMKLSVEETRSCSETLKRIHEELTVTLNEKDRLSLFYGVISRKDYKLRYLNLGSSRAFYAPPGAGYSMLPHQGGAITQKSGFAGEGEAEVALLPESRLIIASDGFIEAVGGEQSTLSLLEKFRQKDAKDLLNELSFQVKSKFSEPDDMPEQDCTAIVMDADSKLLRAV